MRSLLVLCWAIALLAEAAQPKLPPFPQLAAYPKAPAKFQLPKGSNRKKICVVKSGLADTGPAILKAARNCNKGGTVYFPEGGYTIASTLDLTFLDRVDFAIFGTIYFKDDVTLWPGKTFNYPYQTVSLFWRFGGSNVNIYGGGKGVIDGRGQTYWNAMVSDKNVLRPTLFGTDGLHRSTITGLTMKNSPGWFNFISNSTNVLISDIVLDVVVKNTSSPAKNTDGWDTYRSSNIVIQNSKIVNTDDCVSFKPNSTSIIVQGLDCTGSHGISVGSLGQYLDQIDIVEDLYIYNNTMRSASDAARIKVWPGVPPNSGIVDAGGGGGRVRNVTYERFHSVGNDHAIAITQCYYTKNQTRCDQYPAKLMIDDIKFLDFTGTTSKKYAPRLGELICSSPEICSNIQARNINVSPPGGGKGYYTCHNLGSSVVEIDCREV
ncbi:probable Exopolygalacturonase A [Fusarium oxysporum]|uniref:galacturonan 1,4-alpha-galacturonidase n=1 Tax=Fusarium oxysporum TaxID=5507 RepID=A0A2H3SPY0_FUSOX|nr:probable Exopolygalacturonase A [Fusarium oxysporum]